MKKPRERRGKIGTWTHKKNFYKWKINGARDDDSVNSGSHIQWKQINVE